MSSSRGLSQPRDQTLTSPALAGGFFATSGTWEALSGRMELKIYLIIYLQKTQSSLNRFLLFSLETSGLHP